MLVAEPVFDDRRLHIEKAGLDVLCRQRMRFDQRRVLRTRAAYIGPRGLVLRHKAVDFFARLNESCRGMSGRRQLGQPFLGARQCLLRGPLFAEKCRIYARANVEARAADQVHQPSRPGALAQLECVRGIVFLHREADGEVVRLALRGGEGQSCSFASRVRPNSFELIERLGDSCLGAIGSLAIAVQHGEFVECSRVQAPATHTAEQFEGARQARLRGFVFPQCALGSSAQQQGIRFFLFLLIA